MLGGRVCRMVHPAQGASPALPLRYTQELRDSLAVQTGLASVRPVPMR
jgi:hypothetical protein